jgi:hypothetical protein
MVLSMRAAIIVLAASSGCEAARADDVAPNLLEPVPTAAAGQESTAVSDAVQEMIAAPVAVADERAAAAPDRQMPRTTALMLDTRARIGVTLGHPPELLLDNPSVILMWERNDGPRKIVIKRLGGAGLDEARLAPLREAAAAVGLVNARFGAFEDAVAGPKRWPAQIAAVTGRGLGDGAPREALAIVVDVPDLEAVGVLGAWPAGDDGAETVLDVVRQIERCRVVVGSGCVADDS